MTEESGKRSQRFDLKPEIWYLLFPRTQKFAATHTTQCKSVEKGMYEFCTFVSVVANL